MIKNIPKSDIEIRPFKVYKDWSLDETEITASYGVSLGTDLYDEDNDDLNEDSTSKYMLYYTIKQGVYSDMNIDIGDTIGVISIPQIKYGERIRPTTVGLEYDGKVVYDDGNFNLIESGSDDIVGNVFYNQGLIVITDGVIDGSTLNTFNVSYQSTMTIYENEIFLSILENEFNVSQNPTALVNVTGSFVHIEGVNPYTGQGVTSSYFNLESADIDSMFFNSDHTTVNLDFYTPPEDYTGSLDRYVENIFTRGEYPAPFITTIGLYDDDMNMVAVAKLPNPIKKYTDYPINFIIRFDT